MSMSSWVVGFLVVLASIMLAVAGVFIVRRQSWYHRLDSHSDYLNYIYAVIGLIYGVFLAFTTIAVWQEYSDAEKSVNTEVTDLSMLWRDAQQLDSSTRTSIQTHLISYCDAVINSEWKTMSEMHKKSKEADEQYEALWSTMYKCNETDQTKQIYYTQCLTMLNNLGQHRRLRVMYSTAELPLVLWSFLVLGAVITICFPYLFYTAHPKLQSIAIGILTALIAASLFLALSLQHPFSGDISVKPAAFELLKANLVERLMHQKH